MPKKIIITMIHHQRVKSKVTTKTPSGPLAGIKVIDCSTIVAAPTCSQLLGDYGADVIKVESPAGDEGRKLSTKNKDGISTHFLGLNRNKRSIGLDLNSEKGREVLLDLLKDADVFLENFKPGTLEKWGIGYEELLKERFPQLIYCRISGFGADGPLGGLPGYDAVAQAFSGIMSFSGEPDGDPLRVCLNVVDTATGLYAHGAIGMALLERHQSGKGQLLDLSLYDTAFSLMHPFASTWINSGVSPARMGSRHPNAAPYDVYPVADGHVLLCTVNNLQFSRLCSLLDCTTLTEDPRFCDNNSRLANADALSEILINQLTTQEKLPFAIACLEAGIAVGPVLSVEEALNHPHAATRQVILEKDNYKAINNPVKLSRTPTQLHRKPCHYGEHNDEILKEIGLTSSQITALKEQGILFDEPT